MAKTTKKHQVNPMQKYYMFALYLVVLILINLVGKTLFFRLDLTANGLYSLSDASVEAVSTLKEPLTVNVFFSKNLPAPYNNIEQYLHDLLEAYEASGNEHLNYRFYNVTPEEEGGDLSEETVGNRKLAQSYGIHPVNVQKIEQDEQKVQRAYMGMVLIHGDIMEKIPAITSTEGLEYQITSAIRKMNNKISALVNLPEKIKVTLVFSSSIARISNLIKLEGFQGLKAQMQEVVERLGSKTYNQLQFVHIDPSVGEGTPEQLKPFERFGLKWPEIDAPDGSKIPAGQAIIAIGMSYGDKKIEHALLNKKVALTGRGLEERYQLSDIKEIETFINDNIDNIIDINQDVGYLSVKGTHPLSVDLPPQMRMMQQQMPESLGKLNTLLNKEYTVKKVKLGDEDIPESIDTLIIAGAKEGFTDWELFQVDQFLMKGKSLAIFVDSFNEIRQQRQYGGFQQPVYLPINTGLDKLLGHYGVKVKKSYLMDENCYVNRGRNLEEMPIYFAPIIQNEKINHDFDFMGNITQMIAVKVSPLEADEEKLKKNNLTLHTLFHSSDKAWEMSGKINLMPMFIQPPKDDKEKASRPLAYLLEGEFPSYFADKAVPERPRKEEEKKDGEKEGDKKEKEKEKEKEKPVIKEERVQAEREVIAKGKPGRILLVGSSEILKDTVLDEQGLGPNSVFLMNTVDYLNNREDIAVMRSKNQRFNPLYNNISSTSRITAKAFNTYGLPLLFILFGVFVMIRRNARKRKIRGMFEK